MSLLWVVQPSLAAPFLYLSAIKFFVNHSKKKVVNCANLLVRVIQVFRSGVECVGDQLKSEGSVEG